MASANDVTTLLRFLSQEAKVPLAQAMSKIPALQAAQLNTALDLSKADFETLKGIFGDEKAARQCLNAAKRVSKKRSADQGDSTISAPPVKRTKPTYGPPLNGAALEVSLALPDPEMNEDVLKATVLYTNRAPLVLAFATTLIKYTMPEQPLSSRLSLAQAVTSMNSKTKAAHIGLAKGQSAEDEGWGEGQPLVRVMTREIRVMKRWGYEWEDESDATQNSIKSSPDMVADEKQKEPALWGVDLEALKKANQPGASHPPKSGQGHLPIYSAQSARAYLMRAFEKPPGDNIKKEGDDIKKEGDAPTKAKAKRSAASIAAEKERNLGLLLGALDLLYQSWAKILSKEDLDKRAWSWYVRVRPEVAAGAAGWGGKGNVQLADILDLRRPLG